MDTPSRHVRIVEVLGTRGVATVRELAASLHVSESTIRRDLKVLDDNGSLVRSYGGAALSPRSTVSEEADETPFDVSAVLERAAKEAMAEKAAELVADENVVLLDIGTSTSLIARRLRGRPVTVITSNVAVLDELRGDDTVRLVLLGGVLRRNYHSLVGSLTEFALSKVSADIVFLSCTGVRPGGHVVDDMAVEAPIKQAMLEVAERSVLVASGNKFPGTGSLRVCNLTDIDHLVTNAGAEHGTVLAYQQAGGEVINV